MRPYYEQPGIALYHGDCRDVLPHLNLSQAVLLTDPVYGIDGGRGHNPQAHMKGKYAASTWRDDEQYVERVCVPVVEGLLGRVIRGAVTPGVPCLRLYPRPSDMGCFWTPAAMSHGPWGFTTFNPILYYGSDFRAGKGTWPSGRQVTEMTEKNGHPCPKPIGAWTWLAGKVAQKDETLIDPFVGSGTTLRAAQILGLSAIGIEIEERYCEIAAQRLTQAQPVLL